MRKECLGHAMPGIRQLGGSCSPSPIPCHPCRHQAAPLDQHQEALSWALACHRPLDSPAPPASLLPLSYTSVSPLLVGRATSSTSQPCTHDSSPRTKLSCSHRAPGTPSWGSRQPLHFIPALNREPSESSWAGQAQGAKETPTQPNVPRQPPR